MPLISSSIASNSRTGAWPTDQTSPVDVPASSPSGPHASRETSSSSGVTERCPLDRSRKPMPSLDDVITFEPSGDTTSELIGESSEASVRMHHHVRSHFDGNTPSSAPVVRGGAVCSHAAKCCTKASLTERGAAWIVVRLGALAVRVARQWPESLTRGDADGAADG